MNLQTAQDIIDCLPKGHTPFFYERDDYALAEQLHASNGIAKVSTLKKSPIAPLLNKPRIKEIIARSEVLTSDLISEYIYGTNPIALSLTLDTWGCSCNDFDCYAQTSRSGHNLVLQLNWDAPAAKKIVRKFNQLLDFNNFCSVGHPSRQDIPTIAWVRIDCDFDTGEALIEEIQSDWIRDLRESLSDLDGEKAEKPKNGRVSKKLSRLTKREKYWRKTEKHLSKIWSEAALTAAIRFIREDLGIETIYYHTYETGCELKGLPANYTRPPRSLYSDLPKKFGMQRTRLAPSFLKESKRYNRAKFTLGKPEFYTLVPPKNQVVIEMSHKPRYASFLLLPSAYSPH